MGKVRDALSKVWDDLNPSDPSPMYLVKLMAAMMGAFAIGLLIHFIKV
ncbi:hypothetical protein [Tranquillimonas rosea]